MESPQERRRYQRHTNNSPIDLYRMNYQDDIYYAEMNDFSRKGLSLKTNEKLVLGELVYMELKNRDQDIPLMKKQGYSGIVRWGKRYGSADAITGGLYKYGIEFSKNAH